MARSAEAGEGMPLSPTPSEPPLPTATTEMSPASTARFTVSASAELPSSSPDIDPNDIESTRMSKSSLCSMHQSMPSVV